MNLRSIWHRFWDYRGPRDEQPWYLRRAFNPKIRAVGLVLAVIGLSEVILGIVILVKAV